MVLDILILCHITAKMKGQYVFEKEKAGSPMVLVITP